MDTYSEEVCFSLRNNTTPLAPMYSAEARFRDLPAKSKFLAAKKFRVLEPGIEKCNPTLLS